MRGTRPLENVVRGDRQPQTQRWLPRLQSEEARPLNSTSKRNAERMVGMNDAYNGY